MATDQRNLPSFFNSDADFQTWIQGLQAQLVVGANLVRTADTGQVNSATVVRSGINTYAGYEIYRFADALQATNPVFLKIEYGQGAVADRPALAYTVGTGSSGAGAITGQVGTRKQVVCVGSTSAGSTTFSYFCSRADGFVLVNNYTQGSPNNYLLLTVERTKDGTGTATADGIVTLGGNGNSNMSIQIITFTGAIPAQHTSSIAGPFSVANGQSTIYGLNVALVPLMYTELGKLLFGLCVVAYHPNDLTTQVAAATTNLGVAHTYTALSSVATGMANASDSLAILWE